MAKAMQRREQDIRAFMPTAQERTDFTFPPYAEVVLSIGGTEHYLSKAQSWEVRDALALATAVNAGESIVESLERQLDATVSVIMEDGIDGPVWDLLTNPDTTFKDEVRNWGERRGQAQGLAGAIALMRSMTPDRVREVAMGRWESQSAAE